MGALGTLEGWGAQLAQGACHHGLGPAAGALGCPGADSGHSLSFCLFFAVGWAVSPSRCQEVEVSIEGLPVLSHPGSSPLWGEEAAPYPCLLPSQCGGCPGGVCAMPDWWPRADSGTPGPLPPALIQALPQLQDDYIKSWEDNQPGDEGTTGMELGWDAGGSVPASMGEDTFCLCSPPGFFLPAGAVLGPVRAGKRQLAPRRPPSCSLNGALCWAGRWPALPGLPWGVSTATLPASSPLCPPSPGHHQGPLPEGEVQPAQGVRGTGLPARHVHQPQEAGAQVGGWRGWG